MGGNAKHAADWPQWRGKSGAAVSADKNLPVEWGPDSGIKWKVAIPGEGVSSPIVSNGRVFLTTAFEGEEANQAAAVTAVLILVLAGLLLVGKVGQAAWGWMGSPATNAAHSSWASSLALGLTSLMFLGAILLVLGKDENEIYSWVMALETEMIHRPASLFVLGLTLAVLAGWFRSVSLGQVLAGTVAAAGICCCISCCPRGATSGSAPI